MTATVAASAEPFNTPPRVLVTLNGFGSAASATVIRIDSVGNTSFVRAGNPVALVGGGALVYDYEAPFSEPVTYQAVPAGGGAVVSGVLILHVETPWLLHPGVPGLSQPVIVAGKGDRTRTVNQGVHAVLGRDNPIVIGDGVRHGSTYELQLRTADLSSEAALMALLDDGSPLLLQIIYPGQSRVTYEWVSVGDVTISDLVQWVGNTDTLWTLPVTVCSAPAGLLMAQYTWADVVADYPTWADVVAAFPAWHDVVLNNPTNS